MKHRVNPFRVIAILMLAMPLMPAQRVQAQSSSDPLVAAIDTNSDGRITATELKAAAASIRTMDKNNDGIVSSDEGGAVRRGGGSRLGGYTTPPPANNVPAHLFNVILGRLTDQSATVRALFHQDVDAFVEFGLKQGGYSKKTEVISCQAGVPVDFVVEELAR